MSARWVLGGETKGLRVPDVSFWRFAVIQHSDAMLDTCAFGVLEGAMPDPVRLCHEMYARQSMLAFRSPDQKGKHTACASTFHCAS